MPQQDDKRYIFDDPGNVNRLLRGFYIVCGLLFGLDFIIHRHISLNWEHLPGFYAIFGFVACVLLVLVAREMRKVLMRREDYYDVDE
jgi:cytochrome c oxidase subunit IV